MIETNAALAKWQAETAQFARMMFDACELRARATKQGVQFCRGPSQELLALHPEDMPAWLRQNFSAEFIRQRHSLGAACLIAMEGMP
ncbi:hypothetical protein [Solimonas marina]|uniref:Uncharacterized protein n=1 Tax=Solimonas marina TaxID=2714601 RepID=A0A970B7U6_9GAMM|nr:hypothetical protein [Solimonas marina]NKF21594.1 hypothetical protein [Solimonas marina]